MTAPSIGRQFYQDAVHLLMRPGSFYEALPAAKIVGTYMLFLGLTAAVYSVLVAVFTTGEAAAVLRSLFDERTADAGGHGHWCCTCCFGFFDPGPLYLQRAARGDRLCQCRAAVGLDSGIAPLAELWASMC
jgi:hypothetical protein